MTIPTDTPADRRTIDYDAIVHDLAYAYQGIFSQESVAAAVETARQTLEPTAKVREFLPVLVARFAREQLAAAAQAEGRLAKTVPEILFVCVHNAGRSQIAAALAQRLAESTYDPRAPNRPTRSIH
jgi:arsenate reductase (thioredoxin)